MHTDLLLCFNCMQPVAERSQTCPHCGHDNHIRHNGPGLLAETLLGGQYLVGRVLGRGGFGVTYIGYDLNLTQRIAIKEYFPANLVTRSKDDLTLSAITGSEASYENGLQRALKESRMAASLRRIPGVVQVYNVLSANNTMYIIMEYVEGRTLTDYIESAPAMLTPAQVEKLLAPVADALSRLHRMDVVHRDVKPDNIMIRREDEEGVLLDFGAARAVDARTLRNSSAIVSTGYAPVEQYNASGLDGRIDQYALAATLMFTLTGKAPPDVMQRLAMPECTPVLHAVNPAVGPAVEKAVLRGMALKADDRFPDIPSFWDAFCGRGSAAAAKANGSSMNVGKAIAAAAGAVLVGGLLYFAIPGIKAAMNPVPIATATPTPTGVPTAIPTETSTPEPTAVPAEIPTPEPTAVPTEIPTPEPTAVPTEVPTPEPTAVPTEIPTPEPTAVPTEIPTPEPTAESVSTALAAPGICTLKALPNGVEITVPEYTDFSRILHYQLYRIHEGETVMIKQIRGGGRIVHVDEELVSGSSATYYAVAVSYDGIRSPAGSMKTIVWYDHSSGPALVTPESSFSVAPKKDGTVYIKQYKGSDLHIVVPETIGGKKVTGLQADCFSPNAAGAGHIGYDILSVTVPQGVTFLGYGAFNGCRSLTAVTLPEGLITISENCFEKCTSLKNINIPESVVTISHYTFQGCSALESLTIPAGVTSIGNHAFLNCPGLTLTVTAGSYAESYAQKNNIPYKTK